MVWMNFCIQVLNLLNFIGFCYAYGSTNYEIYYNKIYLVNVEHTGKLIMHNFNNIPTFKFNIEILCCRDCAQLTEEPEEDVPWYCNSCCNNKN